MVTGDTVTTNLTEIGIAAQQAQIAASDSNELDVVEPDHYFDGFRCSFIPVRLPGGPDLAFDATLIVAPSATYCVLPSGSVRVANMDESTQGGDCLRLNEDNISYIASVPKGPIAVSHADKVFTWAGGGH